MATIWQHCWGPIQDIECEYAHTYTPKMCIKQEIIDHVWKYVNFISSSFIFHLVFQTFPNVWCNNGLMINTSICHSIWYFAVFFSYEKVDMLAYCCRGLSAWTLTLNMLHTCVSPLQVSRVPLFVFWSRTRTERSRWPSVVTHSCIFEWELEGSSCFHCRRTK